MTTSSIQKLIIIALSIALAFSVFFSPFQSSPVPDQQHQFSQNLPATPVSQMPLSTVKTMIDQYRNNQYVAINNSRTIEVPDAHSVWFDSNTLKKFIHDMETETLKKKPNSKEPLGIRIYFAAYPNLNLTGTTNFIEADFKDIQKNYATRQTVVLIPTIFDKSKNGNVDFNPLDAATYSGFSKLKNKSAVDKATTPSIMALNHGHLIPPFDPIVENF